MVLEDNRWLVAVIGLAVAYLVFRLFVSAGKNERRYQQHLNKIINSDDYKVKGRFE